MSNYALKGEDGDALDDDGIRSLFTDDEFDAFVERVRTDLLPRLGDVRREWESNHSSGEAPQEDMQQLLELFDSLKERFADDELAAKLIEGQIRRTNEWIDENTPEEPERSPRRLETVEASERPQSARSVFDDIDADEGSE